MYIYNLECLVIKKSWRKDTDKKTICTSKNTGGGYVST